MTAQFHGSTYEPEHDLARLSTQLERVKVLMLDGDWRTLSEIQVQAGGSEAGVSARLRDLRHYEHGRYIVDRRRRGEPGRGVFEYRIRKPEPQPGLFDDGLEIR